jgi:FkbM family methyltransferase
MLLDLKNIVKKYNVNLKGVLHIGAHWGEEDSIYDDLQISNRIYFEPLSKNHSVLASRLSNKWQCIKTALGNTVGEIVMNVEEANNGQSSSILSPGLHLRQYPHIKFTSTEIVPITKLDLIPFQRDVMNFINIDVQGYELEVFKGSVETLKTVDYIMTEVNRDEVYVGCAKVNELDSFLHEYGFRRLETTWDGMTWGDAFYAKTSV